MNFTVSVPATTANLGPGFDIWGIALNLRNKFTCNVVDAEPRKPGLQQPINFTFSETVITTSQNNLAANLVTTEKSLIFTSLKKVFERADLPLPLINIEAHIEIPPSRGLGSSSTAVLAGVVMANEILRRVHKCAYSLEQLFNIAVEIEGHPDNIAPALFGGFVLSVFDEDAEAFIAHKLDFKAPLRLAGIIPHSELSTEKARKAVSKNLDLKTWAFQGSRMALATNLLAKAHWQHSDYNLFQLALQDKLHQQARAKYIEGMNQTFSHWARLGALGYYLSGSGTTLLGFWHRDSRPASDELCAAMKKLGKAATAFYPEIDNNGLFTR